MAEAMMNAAGRAAGFDTLLGAMLSGGDADAVRDAKTLIDDARPEDLVVAVDAAVARGVPLDALKPAVSRLVNLLATPLKRHRREPPPGERLFSSLMAENEALLAALDRGKTLAKAINDATAPIATRTGTIVDLRDLIEEVGAIETHYRKKENVLFPWFEARYPEFRCVRLMWEIHDDARRGLKDVSRLLDAALAGRDGATLDPAPLNKAIGRLYFDLNANAFREDYALFPVMMDLVSPADDERLFAETLEYGWALLDDDSIARFHGAEAGAAATAFVAAGPAPLRRTADAGTDAGALGFSGRTGSIPGEALAAMFAALPVDMTYVDANDEVRWFSDSPHRIFPRSPAIIGRDVRNCHPGASVGRVVAIVDAFRRGEKDREAFWITMKDRFIHIEYFALRGPGGEYLGVLEASQDLTELRALSGERRLAD
ncbi:MAG: hypothetical protein CVV47_10725 [Spirochaetae bacterium HGW-Spirochaetae-3]|jgi:hypothetical protein|nr:MAG: hypothetical protein CVV47_10725 [Spirochaetae bacterium HGW-Spirochaetae-3]